LSAGRAANVSEHWTNSDHASDMGLLQALARLVERGLNRVFGGPVSVAASEMLSGKHGIGPLLNDSGRAIAPQSFGTGA